MALVIITWLSVWSSIIQERMDTIRKKLFATVKQLSIWSLMKTGMTPDRGLSQWALKEFFCVMDLPQMS